MPMMDILLNTASPPMPHGPLPPIEPGFWETYRWWLLGALAALGAVVAFVLARRRLLAGETIDDPIGRAQLHLPTALHQPDRELTDAVVSALRTGLQHGWETDASRTSDDLREDTALRQRMPEDLWDELFALLERCDAVRFRPANLEAGEREALIRRTGEWLRRCPRPLPRAAEAEAPKLGSLEQQLLDLTPANRARTS
ncbi:MAG: hypothetical protein ACFB21_10045 [Opitutales bacterium]